MSDIDYSSDNQEVVGTCCFCEGECNPMSQSCGVCARKMTGWSIGMNKIPSYLKDDVIWNPPFLRADGVYSGDEFRKLVYDLKIWCASIDEDPIEGDMDTLLIQTGAVRKY
jgi:hypothetical protein